MNCLKIEDSKGFYNTQSEKEEWTSLDEIRKEDILTILNECMKSGFGMSNPEEETISNKAHEIIYKKLHEKFSSLDSQRNRFKDESNSLFKDAYLKYST